MSQCKIVNDTHNIDGEWQTNIQLGTKGKDIAVTIITPPCINADEHMHIVEACYLGFRLQGY